MDADLPRPVERQTLRAPGAVWPIYPRYVAVICFAIGVARTIYRALDGPSRYHQANFIHAGLEEMSGAVAGFLVFWLIVAIARAVRPRIQGWWRLAPIHLTGAVLTSVIHTTIMWGLRTGASPLLEGIPYDYGDMQWRYFMEMPVDFINYALAVVVVTMLDTIARDRQRQLHLAEIERQLAEAKLESLTLQLQPHFLFNTLNAISAIIYENPRAADRMISQLSDLLRRKLTVSPQPEIPLRDEIELLELYLHLMKARFEHQLEFSLDIPALARAAMVPQMILQPLVENVIEHAADSNGHISLDVRALRHNGHLWLEVQDRGPGLPAHVDHGVGLSNTVQRLRELYGDDGLMNVTAASPTGTLVRVQIPWHEASA